MGFFLQLKLLLWKNFLIRRRNKVRLFLEIIWPLFLFLILMWVRSRGLKEDREECHYLEKAMPSAGQFAFFHSLICNAPNRCHRRNGSVVPAETDVGTRPKLTDFTNEFGRLVLDGGKLPRIIQNYGDLGAILTAVERNQSLGDDFNLRLRDIVQPTRYSEIPSEWLDHQINTKRLDKAMLLDSPQEYYCKKSIQAKIASEMCSENVTFIWDDINYSASRYKWENMAGTLRPSAWHRFQVALRTMALDLDSINFNNISPGSLAILDRFRGKRDSSPEPEEGWCDVLEFLNDSRIPENEFTRTMRGEQMMLKSRYRADPDEPSECQLIFNSTAISRIPGVTAVWKVIKPFVRGKILFTPDTPAVRSVMERVNKTFNNLLSLSGFEEVDTDLFFNRMEQGVFVREMPKTQAGKNLFAASFRQNALFLTPILFRRGGDLRRLREMAGRRGSSDRDSPSNDTDTAEEQEDSMADTFDEAILLLSRFIKCLDRQKVQPVDPEEAEDEAIRLARTNSLWALVTFDIAGNETLEPFVKYRIRMSAERVDTTLDIMDSRTNYRSRDFPLYDLKYITYGFAYLQDMIDSAILEEHTGVAGEANPGRILKQFPFPKYIYDQFIKAVSNTFPMFMVLSWVFTSALVVKSIVYEKEQRIKETLGVMGLTNGVHWAGWFLDTFSVMFVSLTTLSLILVYGKVIEKAAFTVVWLFLTSFAVATLSFSFLISVFFSRANVAAAAAGIIFFTTYMPYPLVLRFSDVIPYNGFIGVSLVCNMAFGLGASVFAAYEQTGEGVQWSNLNIPATSDELVTMQMCIVMLWVDAFIYGVLTWYIEAVFPGQYGIPKPWYFFLQRSYWFGTQSSGNMYIANGDGPVRNMEAEPSNGIIGVSIEKLTKTFGDKAAVNGLSLNFYQDQITCFLGHNGAGKTTTISMLTGMYPPSSGTAWIYGLDIRKDMVSIRNSMGVCPQHNVLFDSLTVEEHLFFFGRIKGLHPDELRTEIDTMLRDMSLENKRNARSVDLSGGMKRKLSVGMAFVGGSRTVFLDEPTAGVDPFSRRAIWELLIKYRKGRTVILTTHFMDEADLLGDRIAIISSGKLQCCGSSVFLKGQFGSGYYLTVEWQQQGSKTDKNSRLRQLVTGTVSSARAVQEMATESVFVLPDRHDVESITTLLEKMDENRDSLGIESYGISDTSLEEIFLKVVEDNKANGIANGNAAVSLEDPASGQTGFQEIKVTNHLSGTALLKQQYLALTRKRFNYVKRDPKGIFTQLVLPALFVALSLTFTNFFNITSVMPELVLEPRLYGSPVVAFWQFDNESTDLSRRELYLDSMRKDGVGSGLVPSRNNVSFPDLPVRVQRRMELAKSIASEDNTCQSSPPEVEMEDGTKFTQNAIQLPSTKDVLKLYYNGTGVELEQWIIDTYPDCKRNRLGGVAYGATYPWTKDSAVPIEGFNNKPDNLRVWYDNKAHAASPSYLNAMDNVMLRTLLPDDKKNESRQYGILTSNHPLPLTPEQYKDKTMAEAGIVLFHAVSVIFAMSFVPASFVIFLIEDRVAQSKHLQLVSGLRPYIYWLQSYTWDMMSFVASEVMVILIFIAFQSAMYTSGLNLLALILLIFVYGMACIPLLYLLSWIFKVPSLAFVVLSCGNLFIGMITTLSVLILGMFEELELQNIRKILEVAFLVFPQYCLGQGLMNIATNYMNAQILLKQDIIWNKSVLDWAVTGKFIFTLLLISAVLVTAVFLAEQSTHWFHHNHSIEAHSGVSMETDVQQEYIRVDSGHADKDVLVLKRLSKVYRQGARPAVDAVSLGVDAGQCFGLLGLNGAGKTSIFKMLTGDTNISGGDAFVGGTSVRADMDGVRKLVGYCPQFDALLPLLTVREHLDLYCSLRGMPSDQRPKAVDRALQRLNLGFHQDKQARSLSGGNKRKLSTAIALIGDPQILYMDEPTTSMDPGARRFLWDCVLGVVASGRSVVLTSHSMEECQALCGKITIMVNGQLTCFGSPQHLKNKYGSGYSVVVRCQQQRVAEARRLVLGRLSGSSVVESHLNQIKLHVPPAPPSEHGGHLRLVSIFRALDEARRGGVVLDYSVSQTTLEDVFMRFAQMQRTEESSSSGSVVGCWGKLAQCIMGPLRSKDVMPSLDKAA